MLFDLLPRFSFRTVYLSQASSGSLLGVALGLLWTPCAGPILALITTIVATQTLSWSIILITLAYSFGACLPMFLIAYGGSKIINSAHFVARYAERIRQFFGLLMIAGALAIAFHADVWLQEITITYFSMITVEDNAVVKKKLDELRGRSDAAVAPGIHAPNFVGIEEWINSPALSIKELQGNVVLIDFWTYSCINCVRTIPYIKRWYNAYKDQGLVIIGVHTPEFEFEKNATNVQQAIKRFGIEYPVALDNNYQTWQAYDNHYWPAHYLIDQKGVIRDIRFGEGDYRSTENALRGLLGLAPLDDQKDLIEGAHALTPETYLGYTRGRSYQPELELKTDTINTYSYKEKLELDHVGLRGSWLVGPDSIRAQADNALLDLNFTARHVYLVMESPTPQNVTLLLDGQPVSADYYTADGNKNGTIAVHEARMYSLIDLEQHYGRHILTLSVPKAVVLYAFTFGAGEKS